MKNLRPIKGKYYIAKLVEEGEHVHQDFKYAISDARKIAHSISAFANNDGGRLLIGVKDNGIIAGVRTDEDIYLVEQAAGMLCMPPQTVEFTPFKCDGGAIVYRAEISKAATRPVRCIADNRGTVRAYYRVADENIPVTPLMEEAWEAASRPVSLTDCDYLVLRNVSKQGSAVEEIAKSLHLSTASVRASVVNLYAAGVVDFAYSDGSFRIIPKD